MTTEGPVGVVDGNTAVPLRRWHSVRRARSKTWLVGPAAGCRGGQGMCVQYVWVQAENKKCIALWLCACLRTHTRQGGQRAGAYINHKLSRSGSRTSNEMVQIKVCLWVVRVRVRVAAHASEGTR